MNQNGSMDLTRASCQLSNNLATKPDPMIFILIGLCVSSPPHGSHTQIRSHQKGWRDGSAVKSIDYSSEGPKFNSQQPHGSSQLSVMRSDAVFWCVWRRLHCIHIHKINKSKQNKTEKICCAPELLYQVTLRHKPILIKQTKTNKQTKKRNRAENNILAWFHYLCLEC